MGEPVDNLEQKLVEFLARNGANFEIMETADQEGGHLVSDGSFGHV